MIYTLNYETMKSYCFNLVILLFLAKITICQNSNYSIGYEKGFKNGYCYNIPINQYCSPPTQPFTPIPRLNESQDNYQQGYNRGFQTGLDLRRLESGGGTTSPSGIPYSSIQNYKFNDYIPEIPVNAYVTVGLYKQALFNKRAQWIQKRIDDLYELASSLLDSDGYKKIQNSIITYGNSLQGRRDLADFADDRVIMQIANSLKSIESQIYEEYKTEISEINKRNKENQFINLINAAYDSLNSNPKLSLKFVYEAENMNIESKYINDIKSIAYANLDEPELALEYRNKYISSPNITHTDLQYSIFDKALLLFKLNKVTDALIQLNNTIFKDADDTLSLNIFFWKTNIYLELNDYQNSLSYADKYLSGKAIEIVGLNRKEAVIRIKQIKAASLRELGRYQEALDIINLTIKENNSTSNPSLYATKGKIFFKMREYKNAMNEFIKITLLDDNDAESFYYLALCYKNLNQKNKACEYLQKAIKLGSKEALEEYPSFCS